jgi:hypothetical protein
MNDSEMEDRLYKLLQEELKKPSESPMKQLDDFNRRLGETGAILTSFLPWMGVNRSVRGGYPLVIANPAGGYVQINREEAMKILILGLP